MSNDATERAVSEHYSRGDLAVRVESALREAGLDKTHLTVEQLAPLDHFHLFGVAGTRELARAAGIAATDRVLDVGGGIGGPARMLAQSVGCSVTVLDLTPEFCRVGAMLTGWTNLTDKVSFVCGSALEMPFTDQAFDVAVTQHASMNIADKSQLYAEIHRVVRPGGRFALFDIMAGPTAPLIFPVPWADSAETSFLMPPDEARTMIVAAGFRELVWEQGAELVSQIAPLATSATGGSAARQGTLGVNLLMGELGPERIENAMKNNREGRTVVVLGVFERV
ncbi:MAG: class I SAM-dependent methyltransferase [Ktedonobacterales bacterium]